MRIHRIPVNEKALKHIINGNKTIEGRLKRGYFSTNTISSGDYIIFINQNIKTKVIIKSVIEYNNIYEFLHTENLNDILPDIKCKTLAYNHYNNFYSDKILNEYQFLAIKIEII